MSDSLTWRALWAQTTEVLGDRPAARWLCETACGLDGDEFVAALDEPATERMVAHLDRMVARHRLGEPLAYVMGRWSFRRIELMVDRRVLVPRPETELLVEFALDAVRGAASRRLLDLGTGSGAIGLSLAFESPIEGTEVWLTDVSTDALDVARANAAGVGRSATNVRFASGDWFGALSDDLTGTFDCVVANPPYIADDDPEVDDSVREWEPAGALFAGHDGLRDVRTIVGEARHWLRPDGWLLVEIGHRQGDAVLEIARRSGFEIAEIRSDLAGLPRFLVAR